MLTIRHQNELRLKCPKHPKANYDEPGKLPASCEVCFAIGQVRFGADLLRLKISMAEGYIRDALTRQARRSP